MADRTDIVLVADGGDITVGRRAATYTYGTFQVTLPDGVDQVPTDDRLQDGYIYRPDNPPTGRFDVGFVRADASVDLQAQTSDVEEVIDLAQRRVEGDVFFERDITAAGLGQNVPGVDFDVGDIVTVELWSKQLPSPVTAWDQITDQSTGVTGDRVHVGGQLIADPVALRRQKNDLEQQIAAETRQRLRQVGQVDQTARSAKSTADTARNEVAAVRDTLAGEQSGEPDLLAQLVAVNNELQRLGQEAQPSLMLAFVALSTALWEAQQKWNRERETIDSRQDAFDADLQEQIRTMEAIREEAERRRPRPVFAKFGEYKDGYVDPEGLVRIEPFSTGDRGFAIQCLGEWTGTMVVRATAISPLSANSIDSVRANVSVSQRLFRGVPEAIQMSYNTLDLTIFPD